MILFLNVFITDQGFTKNDRGLLPSDNRVDIFKYSLASLSVIDWSRVVIYYDLDTNYQHRRREIDEYIRSLFREAIIYPFRNDRQSQWKVAMRALFDIKGDDLVWFCCNDDHIFIDYEKDLLERIEAKLLDLAAKHEYVSCYFTHWPECLYYGRTPPRFTKVGVLEDHRDYFITIYDNSDSAQIVNKKLLRYWWFEHDYGDVWMPRTDMCVVSPEVFCVIPYRELVRHFDGYSHNNVDINVCPPLFIPDGFFNDEIKISYCSNDRKSGYVHVNPMKKNFSTVDKNGADMKCVVEDLPLFWRSRITCVETAGNINRRLLLKRRNVAVLKMALQKTYIPIFKLEIALRFDKNHAISREIGRMRTFALLETLKNMLFKRSKAELAKMIIKRVIGEKCVSFLRRRRIAL